MLWTLLALAIVFSLIAYLYEGLMEENGGERRRQLGGKCLVKYVIVLILLIEPSKGSMAPTAFINKTKEACVMKWHRELGCAGGENLEDKCDTTKYSQARYIWPPNSTKLCNDHRKEWVIIGETVCLRMPYGHEMKKCKGPKTLIGEEYYVCCPVTGLM